MENIYFLFFGGSYSEDVNERITGLDGESPINKSAAGTNDKTGNISTKKEQGIWVQMKNCSALGSHDYRA